MEGTRWRYEGPIKERFYTDNPKKGLGQIVIIEADTAREAWDHGIRLGMSRSSGKWSRPREANGVSWNDLEVDGRYVDDILVARASIYIHFKSGNFYKLNGLHKVVIRDLFQLEGYSARED